MTYKMTKKIVLFLVACVVALAMHSQVPQFSPQEFDGWIYTNPAIALNQTNIMADRIVLYTTSTGLHLTLTSPQFNCYGGQSIDMRVTWITDQWQDPGFDVKKVALTATLLDNSGVAVDSVTYEPTSVSRTNYINLSLNVPAGMTQASLRFAAWKANVKNSGAVKQIKMTSYLRGDVNLDGELSVADINAILQVLLGDDVDDGLRQRADLNADQEVTVADINCEIGYILGLS